MSGNLHYAYTDVEEMARLVDQKAEANLHHAFADHLRLVAKALRDLERVLSGDYGPGDEEAGINAVISPRAELGTATRAAEAALAELRDALERVRESK